MKNLGKKDFKGNSTGNDGDILSGTRSDIVNPTTTDDNTNGFYVGYWWYNTVDQALFFCSDATTAGAQWVRAQSGSGGGVLSFPYKAETTSQAPPPASKKIKWNNATQDNATVLFISTTTQDNVDIHNILVDVVDVGMRIIIFDATNTSIFKSYQIIGITDNTTYIDYAVTFESSSGGDFSNNQNITVAVGVSGSDNGIIQDLLTIIGAAPTLNLTPDTTGLAIVNIGINRGGDGVSELRMQSKGSDNTFYGSFLREAGENGILTILNLGTGGIALNGNVKIDGQISTSVPADIPPTANVLTVDWNNGNKQIVDIQGATGLVSLVLNNPKDGGDYELLIAQGTSPQDILLPSDVFIVGGTAPNTIVMPPGNNKLATLKLVRFPPGAYTAQFSGSTPYG